MPELILKQLQYECDSWKRLLAFMMDENVHLKNRLSEIIHNHNETGELDEAEEFQKRFLKEDEIIRILRSDLAELESMLTKELFENGKTLRQIKRMLNRIRTNVPLAERELDRTKSAFNNYLLANVQDQPEWLSRELNK